MTFWFTAAVVLFAASNLWWYRRDWRRQNRFDRIRRLSSTRRRRSKVLRRTTKDIQSRVKRLDEMLAAIRDGVIWIDSDEMLVEANVAAGQLLDLDQLRQRLPVRYRDAIRYPAMRDAIETARERRVETMFEITLPRGNRSLQLDGRVMCLPSTATIEPAMRVILKDSSERQDIESMRRDLTANLSHELKTPLAAIKGYAETIDLAMEDDVKSARHFMRQLHQQCARMEQMIADMLQLTRVQSGDDRLQIEAVDLASVFDASVMAADIVAAQKQIELVREPVIEAEVFSDREAIVTILNNLIRNAVRYTLPGGRVRTWMSMDRVAGTWTMFVEDNGVGISHQDQQLVFDRFFRVAKIGQMARPGSSNDYAAASRGGEYDRSGTGLGLSIVQTLAESLGGTVQLDSELGRGSRFEVTLPLDSRRKPDDGGMPVGPARS